MSEISNNREESRENDRGKEKEPLLRRAMDAFGTIFALNVCFVVGCIPIFTVGASLSALYAMCIRLQEDEEETVVAGFIHEFKRNFKQSTIAYFFIYILHRNSCDRTYIYGTYCSVFVPVDSQIQQ